MDENVYQSWKVLNQQLDASDVNENDFILILMKCVHQKPEYPIELAAKLQNYNLDNVRMHPCASLRLNIDMVHVLLISPTLNRIQNGYSLILYE